MIPIKQAKILSRQAEELTASLFLPILDHPCHNGGASEAERVEIAEFFEEAVIRHLAQLSRSQRYDRIKKQLDNHPLRGTLSA